MKRLLKLAIVIALSPLAVWVAYIIDSKGVFVRLGVFADEIRSDMRKISDTFYRGHI